MAVPFNPSLLVPVGVGALVYSASGPVAGPPVNYATTPLTLLIFGTLAGYYVAYAVGLLRWQRASSKSVSSSDPGARRNDASNQDS